MCNLASISAMFEKNNDLRIRTYFTQTFVKQIVDDHELAETKMVQVGTIDFS